LKSREHGTRFSPPDLFWWIFTISKDYRINEFSTLQTTPGQNFHFSSVVIQVKAGFWSHKTLTARAGIVLRGSYISTRFGEFEDGFI